MTYRLIKKEEVLALWADVPVKAMKVLKRLLREREVYREILIGVIERNLKDTQPAWKRKAPRIADLEAQRILEKEEKP